MFLRAQSFGVAQLIRETPTNHHGEHGSTQALRAVNVTLDPWWTQRLSQSQPTFAVSCGEHCHTMLLRFLLHFPRPWRTSPWPGC